MPQAIQSDPTLLRISTFSKVTARSIQQLRTSGDDAAANALEAAAIELVAKMRKGAL